MSHVHPSHLSYFSRVIFFRHSFTLLYCCCGANLYSSPHFCACVLETAPRQLLLGGFSGSPPPLHSPRLASLRLGAVFVSNVVWMIGRSDIASLFFFFDSRGWARWGEGETIYVARACVRACVRVCVCVRVSIGPCFVLLTIFHFIPEERNGTGTVTNGYLTCV